MFCQRFFLDSYLTLPSVFGVYHCECQKIACVTRYSRGTENRCGGKYNIGFITIFLRCIIAKNYPNWPRIDKVIAKIKKVQFFLKHSVYPLTLINTNSKLVCWVLQQTCPCQAMTSIQIEQIQPKIT